MSQEKGPTGGGGGAPAPQGPKRSVEEVRAILLADPDVREQARMLQLPVAEYVEKIIDYALHPNKPPQVKIVPDEVLKKQDPTIPTTGEIKTYLEKVVSGEIAISPAHKKDGFEKKDRAREQGRYEEATGTGKARKEAAESTSPAQDETPYKLPDIE
jgi:hypothetical protein